MKQEAWQNYTGSGRWQHLLAPHPDSIRNTAKCLLGDITRPSESRLSETKVEMMLT